MRIPSITISKQLAVFGSGGALDLLEHDGEHRDVIVRSSLVPRGGSWARTQANPEPKPLDIPFNRINGQH